MRTYRKTRTPAKAQEIMIDQIEIQFQFKSDGLGKTREFSNAIT